MHTQTKRLGWLCALLALLIGAGCSDSETKLTQVIVVIDADESVGTALKQVEVEIYDPDASAKLVASQPFATNAGKEAAGAVSFPFSIGVLKAKSTRFLLVVKGYAELGAEAVIEQKVLASFVDGQVRSLGVYLASPCYAQVCGNMDDGSWLALTCNTASGQCESVAPRETTLVRIGNEIDAGLIMRNAGPGDPDSGNDELPDAGLDGALDGAKADAGSDGGPLPTDYALGVAGQACAESQNQTLACEGHASRKVLKCTGSTWELFETCAETARCDSRVGSAQGTCVSIPAACLGQSAGDVCEGTEKRRCGIDLVALEESACAPHAHCESVSGAVRCACDDGYEDDGQGGCRNHDDCPPGACAGGDCVDGLSDYSCGCGSGFAGTGTKACTPVVYCPKDACTPGGTCVDVADWSCHCGAGFSGEGTRACSNIDDCPADRCKAPQGTCTDRINGYTCACNAGYSGTDCAVDACSPNPCQHGGTCLRTAQGASCDCGSSGYGGNRCQTDVNECATTNLCTAAEYPCVQTAIPGYTCRGQMADWPMPDSYGGTKNPPSFDTSTAGIVVDRVTGLIWERDGKTQSFPVGYGNFDSANSYCDALTLAGFTDWRLPTKIELESILDPTKAVVGIDGSVFSNSSADGGYWTSSRALAAGGVWTFYGIAFQMGAGAVTSSRYVRCVRSSPTPLAAGSPSSHYHVDTVANIVTDTRTGLVWQRLIRPGTFTAATANNECRLGFHLPSIKELLTLVDPMRSDPSIDPVFRGETAAQDTPNERFWSTSSFMSTGGSSQQLTVSFSDGGLGTAASGTPAYRVRCVR